MKRLCSEVEHQILYNNRNMIYKGTYEAESKGSIGIYAMQLVISLLVVIAGIIPVGLLLVELDMKAYLEVILGIWAIFLGVISSSIVQMVMSNRRIRRQVSRFVQKGNIAINGATIVGVDAASNMIAYMEDDYADEIGQPIIVDYLITTAEIQAVAVGMRLIVMYDSETSFQLMRVNEQLCQMIPMYDGRYPLQNPLSSYKHLPHPNANNIRHGLHRLNEIERGRFADAYIKKINKNAKKRLITGVGILFLLCTAAGAIIAYASDTYIEVGLVLGLILWFFVMILFLLMMVASRASLKRQTRFEYVQEVMFHSKVMKEVGQTVITCVNVFEWVNGTCKIVSYSLPVPKPVKYGDILYKLTNEKGKHILMKKENEEVIY